MTGYPRELIIASAGSGKTFTLSTRLIQLLACGEVPEHVFASTFTRKAAGEILDRVLTRLAAAGLSGKAAEELSRHTGVPLDRARCLQLLGELVRRVHRLNIGTLDSFFVRAVTGFTLELGLPPGWRIADEVAQRALRSDAVSAVLDTDDPRPVVTLMRLLNRGDLSRSTHERLMRLTAALGAVQRQAGGGAWGWLPRDDAGLLDRPAIEDAIDRLNGVDRPLTKAGKRRKTWVNAIKHAVDAAWSGDWFAFAENALVSRLLAGEGVYDRVDISCQCVEALEPLIAHARAVVRHSVVEQARAMGELAGRFAERYAHLQRERRRYRFEDATAALAGGGGVDLTDLFYRLDGRMTHVLLDEFQDTSVEQWHAMAPMLDEVLAHADGGRATLIVADPKQSIYGWRGGEPLLVEAIGKHYALDGEPLNESWRSSPVVLDAVNAVFGAIADNPIVAGAGLGDEAASWAASFAPHRAHHAHLPGHVAIAVAPKGDVSSQPLLTLQRAADLVAELAGERPRNGIGVLVRKNDSVARMIYELGRRGIDASEEGGNPLTDSPAVVAVLNLLRLADHPGDRLARYFVAHTPLGGVVGFEDHRDSAAARRLAHAVRRDLLVDGYGLTIGRLAERLAPCCDGRDLARVYQLVEKAYAHEATLRPSDFVAVVESVRVEDPSAARVRVMTVHQSKGLEFDTVVLPELDSTIGRVGGEAWVYRENPIGPITRVLPALPDAVRALVPESEAVYRQERGRRVRDDLSTLYVAMTRAKHALHMVVKPAGERESAVSFARVVRAALVGDEPPRPGDGAYYESGDPRWQAVAGDEAAPEAAGALARVALAGDAERRRMLAHVSPSGLEGGTHVDLDRVLRLRGGGRQVGSLIHAWFELIGWLDDGAPDRASLGAAAERIGYDGDTERWVEEFERTLERDGVWRELSRESFAAGATVHRERPFAVRLDDRVVEGVIDRLVIEREGDDVTRAVVIDFKTDAVGDDPHDLDAAVAHYRPQLEVYRRAVATVYGVGVERVEGRLLFTQPGKVVAV